MTRIAVAALLLGACSARAPAGDGGFTGDARVWLYDGAIHTLCAQHGAATLAVLDGDPADPVHPWKLFYLPQEYPGTKVEVFPYNAPAYRRGFDIRVLRPLPEPGYPPRGLHLIVANPEADIEDLHEKTYTDARTSWSGWTIYHPLLVLRTSNGTCPSIGTFTIHTLRFDSDDRIARLSLSFERRCTDSDTVVRGCFSWERP